MSLVIPPEAVEAQRRSSDPAASAFVSANAGAGKTYVLAQRVVRLLLSGVAPSAILCLTFTNAAAAEMAGRVFKQLARLATLEDAALRAEVENLAPDAEPTVAAARARTLFAQTLETPGGLKVATIHAFAASLLRRFPLEAGVAGSFEVLDDPTRTTIEDRAIAETLAEAAGDAGGPVAEALLALLPALSDASVPEAIKTALAKRQTLATWLAASNTPEEWADDLAAACPPPADTPRTLSHTRAREIAAAIAETGAKPTFRHALADYLEAPDDTRWRAIFFTKAGPRSISVAKALAAHLPTLADELCAEQARLIAEDDRHAAIAAARATVALMQLVSRVRERVERETRRRGLLHYDEQIGRAAALVATADAAAWVRFKLDEGIDHVMVDEAQDTSPDQWALANALVEEFFAGASAKTAGRTLFVVGDEKQSIYSFQGAAPHLFSAKRADFAKKSADAGLKFEDVALAHSFRSAPQVLSAVDAVFAQDPLAASVGATAGAVRHEAIRGAPGGVTVWPLFASTKEEPDEDWAKPLDAASDGSGEAQLARAIVGQIRDWQETGPDGGPPVRPGGVFVLTRSRGTFAGLMNRELKAAGIPAAGVDRLIVTDHIAVKDLLALARALISADDLSLAAVLRSPLFDLSDDALFALAHGRTGTLMAALAEGDETARAAHADLQRWQRLAVERRPFDLFAQILYAEGRRRDFAARMGAEAEDALDAFMDLALAEERRGVPALEPFLARMERVTQELRRTVDDTLDAVRVMTVHGAKGLEADVVFLADIGSQVVRGRKGPLVARQGPEDAPVLLLAPHKDATPRELRDHEEARKAAETEEHHRLLYVGMTRARRHLVVCGAHGTRQPPAGMWHELVGEALSPHAVEEASPAGPAMVWRHPPSSGAHDMPQPPQPEASVTRPTWLDRPAIIRAHGPEPLAASDLGHGTTAGAGAMGDDRALSAAAHGTLIHTLCERAEASSDAMARLVRREAPALSADAVAAIVAEANAALSLPELAAKEVWHEVPLLGDVTLAGGAVRRVSGRIDRLQRDGERLLVVDFKTDRTVPESPGAAPDAYAKQLALYRALLSGAMPGASISAAIVWTAAPAFMAMDAVLPAITAVPARPERAA